MAAISGKDGAVSHGGTDFVDTLGWTLNEIVGLHPYGSNATSGGTRRVAGRSDWNGTVTFAYQSGAPEIRAGDSVALVLDLNATKSFSGTGIFGNVAYNVDVNTGAIVSVTANFEANGALTAPTA